MEDSFVYEAKGPTLIIHLPKEFDHHNCRNLRYETDLLMAENYINKVVFDFSRTEFMDSSGIGIIMGRYKKIACFGGRVYAIHADRQIQRILCMSGLNEIVEVLK